MPVNPQRKPGTHWATNGRVLHRNVTESLEVRLYPEREDEARPVTCSRQSDEPSTFWSLVCIAGILACFVLAYVLFGD